ncbi:MAG: glycosyltransferase family 2 protein [Vulcanimicrobiota bacterium]
MNTQTDILRSIVEMQETAINLCRQAIAALQNGREKEAASFFSNLRSGAVCVKDALSKLAPMICRHSSHAVICENLLGSMEHFSHFWEKRNRERALIVLKFEIMALLRDLKEDLYFWNFIYPDEKRMAEYYAGEFARNQENEYIRDGYRHQVSIVVFSYNKIDYTRQCIQYLFKNTDLKGLNCELITINNGSSDETESFFESLPHKKKLNLAMNSLPSIGLLTQNAAEGRYVVLLANDVIVTERWLENLLACIKSDDNVIAACPVANYVSNLQTIPVEYKSIEEMQSFAREYNKSNPLMWEERARLLPIACLFSLEKMNKTGFFDRYFYTGEFMDDDFTLRCRRAGYRQILCRDTFVHHFGSITSGEAHTSSNSLGKGRDLFLKKHGIDAWDHDFCHNPIIISHLSLDKKGRINILGIDSGIGSTPLQIKASLRQKGNTEAVIYNFTTDKRFLHDLNPPVSDFFSYNDNICEIENTFEEIEFDYVYVNEMIESYDDFFKVMGIIGKRITKDGQLILKGGNFFSIETLCAVLTGSAINRNGLIRFYDLQSLQEKLGEYFKDLLCAYFIDDLKSSKGCIPAGGSSTEFLNQCFQYLHINASTDHKDLLNCSHYFIIAGKK